MLKKLLLTFIFVTTYIYILLGLGKIYIADYFSVKSDTTLSEGDIHEALRLSNKAITYNPKEPSYHKQKAKVLIASTVYVNGEDVEILKNMALEELLIALELNPTNLATLRNTAPLYFFLANKDLAKPTTQKNIDERFLPIAQEYFKQIQNYTPNDVGVQVLSAKYQKRLGLDKDYLETIERIKVLRPDLLVWHTDLQ